MNFWLRARVVFQGLTVVALVGGSWVLGQTPAQQQEAAEKENERVLALAARDREEFEKRLRAAEEAHAQEEDIKTARAEFLSERETPQFRAKPRELGQDNTTQGRSPLSGTSSFTSRLFGWWGPGK
jgi:hypothetical protein